MFFRNHFVCLFGAFFMFFVHWRTHKKYGIGTLYAFIFSWVVLFANLLASLAAGKVYDAIIKALFDAPDSNYAVYGIVILTPLFVILYALVTRKPWKELSDMYAPAGMLFLAFAKLNCAYFGCCPGIECSFGVYNKAFDTVMFPSQIFEAITIFAIAAVLLLYAYKSDHFVSGSLAPLGMMLYSFTRFFWEFLRYYMNPAERHCVFGLTIWQFVSILVCIGSTIWFTALYPEWLHDIKSKFAKPKKQKNIQHRKRRK